MDHPLIDLISAQIAEAERRGDFDNLPGAGKPLPKVDDPENALLNRVIRENGAVPEFVTLSRELERLREELRATGEPIPPHRDHERNVDDGCQNRTGEKSLSLMCGRFAITVPDDAMAQIFAAAPANDLPPAPNYNVCPTTQIHVVFAEDGQRRLAPMRWGFIPHWYKAPNDGPLLINARAETIAEKPAFRAACRSRRCLIPADGFYEWHRPEGGEKQPWFIRPAGEGPMVMAGIWQDWEADGTRVRSCAIVTTEATRGQMADIHHRIPVLLGADDWGKWLGEEGHGAATLMREAEEGALTFHRVSTAVNSNRARGPELIAQIET